MLSAVNLASGGQLGMHTNHERMNGLNGGLVKPEPEAEMDKGKAIAGMPTVNGDHEAMMAEAKTAKQELGVLPSAQNLYQLPDEIQHITADIMPLSLLLTRLAQLTHNETEGLIAMLASKPLPDVLVNGNSDYRGTPAEDSSLDSLEKKRIFLEFLQTQHTKWLKALVIANWSKKSDQVGRLIDIRNYLAAQLDLFTQNIWELVNLKRDLHWARLPSPDLKTALQILEEGEATFLPEFNYIDPPPIPPKEVERNIENLNTILSVRLSLDEFDRVPLPFRDYTVHSGRVTFKIEGEFEVDLTVADEDFDSQFWFIDFRLLFTPASREVPEHIRNFLEGKANEALKDGGLAGCYKLLHEFVLTLKTTEIYQQAIAMSRGRWIETLKVERLNRYMALQYWANRYPTAGPQSWVLVGTKSGDDDNGLQETWSPSSIYLRWFRDAKEVQDFDIPLDLENISVEDLLTVVVARHVEHTLTSIQDKLQSKPRFANKQASLSLKVSKEDPTKTSLTLQLFDDKTITVSIDPTAGYFLLSPQSPLMQEGEKRLNASLNLPDELPGVLEKLRVMFTTQELNHRSRTSGWSLARSPIRNDELKSMVSSREPYQATWLRHRHLPAECYVMLTMSLAGDRWWLVKVTPGTVKSPGHVSLFTPLPLAEGQPSLSDRFLDNLLVFAVGIVTRVSDINDMRSKSIRHVSRMLPNRVLSSQIRMPTLFVRLSELLQSKGGYSKSARLWAQDFVSVSLQGVQNPSDGRLKKGQQDNKKPPLLKYMVEARLSVTDKSKFSLLKGKVDRDVVYNARTGQFALRLRADVGEHALDLLIPRLRALERLVNFVDAIAHGGRGIVPHSMTLRSIKFAYGHALSGAPALPNAPLQQKPWEIAVNLSQDQNVVVSLTKGNPHIRMLDFLNNMANARFEQLPGYLLKTLPFFRTLDKMEDGWSQLQANVQAQFYVFPKSLESFTIQYTLQSRRVLNLDARLQSRKGDILWHVRRLDIDHNNQPKASVNNAGNNAAIANNNNAVAPSRPSPPDDDYAKLLGPKVWSTSGPGWKGLEFSAAADMDGGIEALLLLIDQLVHTLVPIHPNMQAARNANAAMARSASQTGGGGAPDQTPPSTNPSSRFSQNSSSQGRHSQQTAMTPNSSQSSGGGGARNGGKTNPQVVVIE